MQTLGILLILVSLACAGGAYLEAGGMHGWSEFARSFPDNLGRNSAPMLSLGFVGLFVLGLVLYVHGGIIAKRKKAEKAQKADDQRKAS